MSVVRAGEGLPVTVFAPGEGATVSDTQLRARGVLGTTLFFEYERIAPWDAPGDPSAPRRPRRQADRDAEELLAVADVHQATRAAGFSRGARAIVGVLAEESARFERVALVLPPGGQAAGRYAPWLAGLLPAGPDRGDTPAGPDRGGVMRADILVVGQRGDRAHPAGVAREWAERLGARLEVLPSGGLYTTHGERFLAVLTEFLNQ